MLFCPRDDLFLEVIFCRRPDVDLQKKGHQYPDVNLQPGKYERPPPSGFTVDRASLPIALRICGKFQFFYRKYLR